MAEVRRHPVAVRAVAIFFFPMAIAGGVGALVALPGCAPAASESSTATTLLSRRCEREQDGVYETRGPATIEKLGNRYVLSVRCEGIHQVYVRVSPTLDLERFVGKPVRARYRYIDEPNARTTCVRAPCPPATERVVEVIALEEVAGVTAR
jgi:hypothetical protein